MNRACIVAFALASFAVLPAAAFDEFDVECCWAPSCCSESCDACCFEVVDQWAWCDDCVGAPPAAQPTKRGKQSPAPAPKPTPPVDPAASDASATEPTPPPAIETPSVAPAPAPAAAEEPAPPTTVQPQPSDAGVFEEAFPETTEPSVTEPSATEPPAVDPFEPTEPITPPPVFEEEEFAPAPGDQPKVSPESAEAAPAPAPEVDEDVFDEDKTTGVLTEPGGWASQTQRQWRQTTGVPSVSGRLVRATREYVVVAGADGANWALRYESLSVEDLQFLRKQIGAMHSHLARQIVGEARLAASAR